MPNNIKRRFGTNAKFEGTSALYARFALRSVQTHLRYLAHHANTERALAQLVLTQAHLDEAIGILATILPEANPADSECGDEDGGNTENAHAPSALVRAPAGRLV